MEILQKLRSQTKTNHYATEEPSHSKAEARYLRPRRLSTAWKCLAITKLGLNGGLEDGNYTAPKTGSLLRNLSPIIIIQKPGYLLYISIMVTQPKFLNSNPECAGGLGKRMPVYNESPFRPCVGFCQCVKARCMKPCRTWDAESPAGIVPLHAAHLPRSLQYKGRHGNIAPELG